MKSRTTVPMMAVENHSLPLITSRTIRWLTRINASPVSWRTATPASHRNNCFSLTYKLITIIIIVTWEQNLIYLQRNRAVQGPVQAEDGQSSDFEQWTSRQLWGEWKVVKGHLTSVLQLCPLLYRRRFCSHVTREWEAEWVNLDPSGSWGDERQWMIFHSHHWYSGTAFHLWGECKSSEVKIM